jgi:hypothetical protein
MDYWVVLVVLALSLHIAHRTGLNPEPRLPDLPGIHASFEMCITRPKANNNALLVSLHLDKSAISIQRTLMKLTISNYWVRRGGTWTGPGSKASCFGNALILYQCGIYMITLRICNAVQYYLSH